VVIFLDFKPELEQLGQWFKEAIQATIDSSMPPPNSPRTIRRKGHGRTLIDTRKLWESIAVEVSDGVIHIGVLDPKVAKYAQYVHDGTRTIPPRPFIAKTVDEEGDKIFDRFEEAVLDKMDRFFD